MRTKGQLDLVGCNRLLPRALIDLIRPLFCFHMLNFELPRRRCDYPRIAAHLTKESLAKEKCRKSNFQDNTAGNI